MRKGGPVTSHFAICQGEGSTGGRGGGGGEGGKGGRKGKEAQGAEKQVKADIKPGREVVSSSKHETNQKK